MARSPTPSRSWLLTAAAAGGVLAAAITVIALTQDSRPPPPAELSGQGLGGGRVRLDWAGVDAANGYQVRIWTGDRWQVLPGDGVGLDLEGTSAEVSGLATGSQRFSVRAIGPETLSEWSDSVTLQIARMPSQPPVGEPAAEADSKPAGLAGADPAQDVRTPLAPPRSGVDSADIEPGAAGLPRDPNAPVPGSTCATAQALGDITGAAGEIDLATAGRRGPGRSNAISFELGPASLVNFAVGEQAAAADMYLYNEWGRRLAHGPGPGPAGGGLTATLLGGSYCLHVVAVESAGRELRLAFAVSDVDGELPANLAARGAAVDLGGFAEGGGSNELFGSLPGRTGAADYFRLSLAEPARLVLAASQLESETSLQLEDRTGGVVATGSGPDGDRVGLSVTLTEGTYFVRVQSDASNPDDYRLSYALYDPGRADIELARAGATARLESSFARIESMLLPDLVSEPPEDAGEVSMVITPEGEELRALRFGGYVTNIGAGPLDLAGNPQLADSDEPTSHDVWQYAQNEAGDWIRLAKPPVRYETSDGHNHFHLLAIVAYSLWDSTGTILVRPGAKTGFCLLDFEELAGRHARPGEQRYSEADVEDCMANRPGAETLRMGVSEGWRDFYDRDVPFQWIDVSDVAPGLYRIGAEADPYDIVAESDEANNGVGLSELVSVVPGFVATAQVAKTDPGRTLVIELGATRFGEPGPLGHRIVDYPENGTLGTGADFTVYDADGIARQGFFSPIVRYTPNEGFVGVDTFTFAAFDAWLPQYPINPAVASVTVDVTGLQPTVTIRDAPDSIDAEASVALSAEVSGAGPDVLWTISAPAGAGKLFGEIDVNGLYTAPIQSPPGGAVTVRAASRQAPSSYSEIAIKVRPAGNSAPITFAPGVVTTRVGDPVDVWVAASDAQRDPLTWISTNLPPGLEIVRRTGRIVGNPVRVGSWRSTISVSDGQLSSVVAIDWVIG